MTHPDEVVIYNTDDGKAQVRLQVVEHDAWLTQKQMAQLFDVTTSAISHHIKDVTLSREIGGEATFKQLLKVPGQPRPVYPPTYRISSHLIASHRSPSLRIIPSF